MQKRIYGYGIATLAGIATLTSGIAFGGGFEKNVLFSGKYAGRGGAAVSDVRGAEALFFNPAGLAEGTHNTFEATGDFSPTWGHFESPLTQNNVNVSGNATFDSLYGAFASYNINEQWGVGIGSYTGSGVHSEYDNSTFSLASGASVTNNVEARLYDLEVALGSGYEVLPGLRIRAAWRISHVSASLIPFG